MPEGNPIQKDCNLQLNQLFDLDPHKGRMQSSLSSPDLKPRLRSFIRHSTNVRPSSSRADTVIIPSSFLTVRECCSQLPPLSLRHSGNQLISPSNHQSITRPSKPNLFPSTKKQRFSTELHCGNSTNSWSAECKPTLRQSIECFGELLSTAFPIWVALGCLLGLLKPAAFIWVTPNLTIVLLAITMLGMGMTLTFDDLRGALAMPKEALIGFLLQYSVMPLSGYLVGKMLNLPSYYAAGLILVACCPGGTASNIVTYLARGNVALSVLMTAASTLSAVVMTPFLTAKLAGQYVPVDAAGLLMSTLQVVLLPVLAGTLLNQYLQGFVRIVSPVMPPIAVATVAILCGHAIAQNSAALLTSGLQVVLASLLLHASGFSFGYLLSRMLRVRESSARTISIEVGMQNSVLGLVLASQHFGNPLTAVPCAVSSVCHSILGSALAGIWRFSAAHGSKD